MPQISVIVPVYNVEKFLPRCIESVLAQAFTDFELILVDDGSPDNCGAICDEYAAMDSRIRVIHKANGGAASARNCGLDAASGKYIAFVDSDDSVHEKYLSIMHDAMIRHGADLVLCGFTSSREELSVSTDSPEEKALTRAEFMSAHHTKFSTCGRLYSRGLIGGIRFNETIGIEDAPFNAALMQANPSARIVCIDLRLYLYNQRDGSLTRSFGPEDYYELSAYYCDCAGTESDPVMRRIFAEESVKRGLSAMLIYYMDRDTWGLRQCQSLMRKSVGMTGWKRAAYTLFIECPCVFKWFRFRQDPSLRGWKRKSKSAAIR